LHWYSSFFKPDLFIEFKGKYGLTGMQRNLIKQYFIIVIFVSLAIAFTIRFPLIMRMIFEDGGGHGRSGFTPDLNRFLIELFISFMVAFLMFTMNYFILKPAEKHIHIKILDVILAVAMTFLAVSILNHLLFSLSVIADTGPPRRGRRNEFDFTNFYVSGLVVGCVLVIRLMFQKQNIMLENESLKREALQRQYESLKNQLSPHFLFNSLTALKTLIQDAPDKAQNYVSSLSRALRYTLRSNEKKLVTLREELEFMESYLYLIKMRFDTNLTVKTSIDENLLAYNLPPLTLQTLVENAIKHNEISKRRPLKIELLSTEAGSLRVINDIQLKLTDEDGTGIGLANLSKQFLLLIGKEISISREENMFIVEIPLIRPDDEKGTDY
jgi:uncharacterized membrane-anchored protein YhcB (DUF1043 family)